MADEITIKIPKLKRLKAKFFMLTTVILALIIVLMIGGVITVPGVAIRSSVSAGGDMQVLSAQAAADKAILFINNNLVQEGQEVSFVEVNEVSGMYNVTLNYLGNDLEVYVTKDGTQLFLNSPVDTTEDLPEATTTTTQPAAPIDVSADDDAVKGDPDAPVEIVEFSDFQCPYCARFWSDTLPSIQSEYIDTGKVKLIHRDFPLSFHSEAQKAAEAAECAGEQGKYYEYHDILYGNQDQLSVSYLKQHAADLGLDTEAFNDCLDSGEMEDEVAQDMADGSAAGVTGTPAFFVNGIKVVGAQPFSVFKEVIDSELGE